MIPFKSFMIEAKSEPTEKYRIHSDIHEDDPDFTHEHNVQHSLFGANDYVIVFIFYCLSNSIIK
jgi:hypothetical protein